jgi:hypothetical protein
MRQAPGARPPDDDAQVFLLHVWQQAGAFRASLRAPGEEEARWFGSADALSAFVQQLAGAPRSTPLEDSR